MEFELPEFEIPEKKRVVPFCPQAKITFSTSQKVITRQLGFQNGVGLLCTAACCGRDHCGERGRELQRQTRVSSRREIGIRDEKGWVASKGNELVSLVNSFTTGPRVAQKLQQHIRW